MSAAPKTNYINAHVVDILGSTKGRDQPIMKMDKAIELIKCLDPKVLASDDYVFFDPFCKAGEVLLAAALMSALSRKKQSVVSQKEVEQHLYESNRFFGMAPDERHYHLSLRTFFGNEKSHNDKFTKNIRNGAYLSEEDGRLNKEKFKKELKEMIAYIENLTNKPIIAIGNPPYQEDNGGGNCGGAKPIYNIVIEGILEHQSLRNFLVVIPSRWLSSPRKDLTKFRTLIVDSEKASLIRYFQKAEDVFPTVQVKGGICFLYYKEENKGTTSFIDDNGCHGVNLRDFDIIPDDPVSRSIIKKVLSKKGEFVSSLALPGNPFKLRTYYFKRANKRISASNKDVVKCYSTGREVNFVRRDEVKKNKDKIDKYKIIVPATYGKGMRRCTIPKNQFFIAKKGEIVTETFNIVACFKKEKDAKLFIQYLRSNFSRYLAGLRKQTARIPASTWAWVPLVDISKEWNDHKLSKYFALSENECSHIQQKVEEWS